MLTACIFTGFMILVIEGTLWHVFRGKAEGICFPRSTDHSFFRFFTISRMRVIAIFHALFLLAILVIFALFLW